ncbi:conserved hypothetical protein [Candidatus Sulfopaludibacter sp. SbA3]|nr:conserved hypothetical protein [Candidatus Sulfopaludibacter sp. SbA3]
MRYWAYFSAKMVVAGGALYGLLVLVSRNLPKEIKINEYDAFRNGWLRLGYNVVFMAWFLLAAGALYLIIRDQRYRCRVCLRRLRMPIETGSWGQMLQLGRPRTEYICPYGHGTLTAEELQISGLANPEWTPHSNDMWDELYAASEDPGDRT